jgi:hypothetical protein
MRSFFGIDILLPLKLLAQSPSLDATLGTNPSDDGKSSMSRTLIVFGIAATFWGGVLPTAGPQAAAEELHEPFLDGLRERGYYDFALYYLDKLDERTDLPAEIKQVISYQRAITLLDGASAIDNPELRDDQLDRAVAQLEAFTRANPNHPLAGNANTQLARILIEKARVRIWESESPANKENNEKFRLEGRDLLTKAREIFQKAHDQHKTTFDKFPKYIEDTEQHKAPIVQAEYVVLQRCRVKRSNCFLNQLVYQPRWAIWREYLRELRQRHI